MNSAYCPRAGDTNIKATMASCAPAGNFIVRIWGDQNNANSQISPAASNSNRNPLLLELYPGWVIAFVGGVARGVIQPVGTAVLVDIVQAEFGVTAVNARLL
jgi:hypothetical protein